MHKTLVVVDREEQRFEVAGLTVITFEEYLSGYPKLNEPKTRIINLCNTSRYLSRGYYCSLLAEARRHRVLPSVGTINDLRALVATPLTDLDLPAGDDATPELRAALAEESLIYFGWSENPLLKKLARQIFDRYPAPILKLRFQGRDGERLSIRRVALADLEPAQRESFMARLNRFTERVWRNSPSRKTYRWDMAILVNPDEKMPPSDKGAIRRFIKAAAKVGIQAETITPQQASEIPQYDALFIRETTAIDHHTYRLARAAEHEGLVVVDDATSILRCCNKVFLHDAYTYNGVPSLKTQVVIGSAEADLDHIEAEFDYPLVLKTPEGSFSKGVFRIDDRTQLKAQLKELLSDSALMLVQEYFYTEFDWRIGVLNGRAIYACKYLMARNHWQIYNHDKKRAVSGGFETLPTFEVPKPVLDAALKACAIIGRGLYGVDLKQRGREVYVIEVNDNPSIEHGVEDIYLGDELYMLIMQEFADRLERRGRS